ncbi:MAG TPA: hypothetical protein PLV77_06745, partial [Solirubrobacterales bacterium]|nr:hypothetical protein [Solirubrobacterales bacterium]
KGYGWQTPVPSTPPTPPAPPAPKRSPASDEERMIILRMVEEGKISVEQAADYVENGTKPDPEVTKTGIVVATKDNIDDPEVSKFLYPAK